MKHTPGPQILLTIAAVCGGVVALWLGVRQIYAGSSAGGYKIALSLMLFASSFDPMNVLRTVTIGALKPYAASPWRLNWISYSLYGMGVVVYLVTLAIE